MNPAAQKFIQAKRLAVVGVSRAGNKFGNMAYKELKERGYQVFAVHPQAETINAEPCYPNLEALRGQVDGVLVVVPPAKAVEVVRQAAALGIKNVWLQQGSESPEALDLGRQLGLNLVSERCILMYAPPVRSFHNFHGWFVKLVGKY